MLRELEEAWSSVVPEDPFEWSFLDANLEAQYREEERWTRIVGLSAGFVVAITCLGLLGQVTMAVTRRTREIGIRKVLGGNRGPGREADGKGIDGSSSAWRAR